MSQVVAGANVMQVDGATLLRQLDELGKVGAGPDGAISRVAFTPDFLVGRDLVRSFMAQVGLRTWVDGAGNLFGRLPEQGHSEGYPASTEPVVVVGSHLDTVPQGGLLDGAYGVLAGLAALSALAEAEPQQARRVVLAGFCNEEGAFGSAGMTGSRTVAQGLCGAELDRADDQGVTLRARLAGVAGPGETVEQGRWQPGAIASYVEVHIEQGPVMEQRGEPLAVVRAITGRALFDIELVGKQAHAGTTPMAGRADAVVAAAEVTLAVERLARLGSARVATVGAMTAEPGSRNTVAGRARLVGELRDGSQARMQDAMDLLASQVQTIAQSRELQARVERVGTVLPVPTDGALRGLLVRAAQRAAHEAGRHKPGEMDSGAGHDAQSFAGVAPIGMLFVPSRGGVSHSGEESTVPEDLVLGAQALAYALAELTSTWPRGEDR